MKSKKSSCLLFSCLFFCCLVSHGAPSEKGKIKAFEVQGNVILQNDNTQETQNLVTGNVFDEKHSVITSANSSCALIFSNGSSIRLKENTTFSIQKFLQEPYDPSQGAYESLSKDPSESITDLFLNEGTIVFNVKQLKPKSDYKISTPAGSAGIRGTSGTIYFKPGKTIATDAKDPFKLKIVMCTGKVHFSGVNKVVNAGRALSLEGSISPNGSVSYSSVNETQATEGDYAPFVVDDPSPGGGDEPDASPPADDPGEDSSPLEELGEEGDGDTYLNETITDTTTSSKVTPPTPNDASDGSPSE